MADRPGEQLVAAEALEERSVVGVEPEHEAEPSEPGLRLGRENERPVRSLPGRDSLPAGEYRDEDAVVEAARRITCARRGERERVGAARPESRLERHDATLRGAAAGPMLPEDVRRGLRRGACWSADRAGTLRLPST